MDDRDYNLAMAHLEAGCIANGIASIAFKDGQLLMVSLQKLRDLVEQVEESGKDRAIIFVQHGSDLKENIA